MKLSKTQAELLEAMETGVVCHYMPYAGRFNPASYYFRSDTMKHCTAPAKALLAKGLVEVTAKGWQGHKLVFKQQTTINRKLFVCVGCECVYADFPVSQCDCMQDPPEFIETTFTYSKKS